MRGGTVQIRWHDTKPVLTLDFHAPSSLLATGGADHDIKLWEISVSDSQKKAPTATYNNSLSYHGSAVNVLRFSSSGELLASGADGGELVLWKLHSVDDSKIWKVLKTLSFHRKDVLDLQWSSDGAFLVSGSVDNSCIIWDVTKGSVHQILDAHLHYVQGVAWDPLGHYVASLSSDRTCRIYVNKPQAKVKGREKVNYVCQHVLTKVDYQKQDDSKSSKMHLFHDETLPSFFRRLSWSPDGSFLLLPAGTCKFSPASEIVNTAYVFSRKDLSRPTLQLPGSSKAIVAVRFCPVVFSLRGSGSATSFKLPYRVVFALASLNSLYIYDTESVVPIAILAGLHYAAITDICWSPDAKYLAVSSQDGYCTLLEFENDELGSPISQTEARRVAEVPHKLEDGVSMEVDGGNEAIRNEVKQALPDPGRTVDVIKPGASTEINGENEANRNEEKQALPDPARTVDVIKPGASMKINGENEANRNEGKHALPNPARTTDAIKPARKRITPVAIDKQ